MRVIQLFFERYCLNSKLNGKKENIDSVEKALDFFVTPEYLDDKITCSKCNKMTNAIKGLKFTSLSNIISFQVKRFTYSKVTYSRIKISKKVSYPLIIDMNKWLNTASQQENKEEEENEKEEALSTLQLKQKILKEGKDNFYELYAVLIHRGGCFGKNAFFFLALF